MARTLPPAKQGGGGRLQHSTKKPREPMEFRESTPESREAAKARVVEGKRRAGLTTPEAVAASHAAAQAHLPRMIAWINRAEAENRFGGHERISSHPGRWETPGDTSIYVRPDRGGYTSP